MPSKYKLQEVFVYDDTGSNKSRSEGDPLLLRAQGVFDSAVGGLGGYIVLEKIKRYNEAIRHAPLKLVDVYIHLYVKNYTQEGLSVELNYSPEHIQRLNKQLLLFLQAKLSEGRSSA